MRFAVLIALVSAAIGVRAGAAEECGPLGVFEVDPASLPVGMDPARVRKCKEHPLSVTNTSDLSIMAAKRVCWIYTQSFGCSGGYCWKKCPSYPDRQVYGYWCWTAHDAGWGPWQKCVRDSDCEPPPWTGTWSGKPDCGRGDCSECGCYCNSQV